MSQHDYVIDNASGATVRADINSALSAIQSLNSGSSAPSSTVAGMLWLDTTGGVPYALKVRDAGNNHWLTLGNVTDPGSDGNLELLPGKINLPSSGGIHESDGSTEILTESSGIVSLKNTVLNSSNSFPTGHIIQQKTTILTSATSFQGTATAITGIAVTLDNLTAGSDVLIFVSVSAANGSGTRFGFSVSKSGTTALTGNIADAAGNRPRVAASSAGPGGNDLLILSFVNLDDNVSAGSATYTVIGYVEGGTCKINRSDSDSDSTSVPRGISSITCLEVAQ